MSLRGLADSANASHLHEKHLSPWAADLHGRLREDATAMGTEAVGVAGDGAARRSLACARRGPEPAGAALPIQAQYFETCLCFPLLQALTF